MPDRDTSGPSVLIIEDDSAISEIVSRALQKEGFVTYTAFDGAQGLDAYHFTSPDIIILDVKMPVMDGWETLTRLRHVTKTPVIMLTAYTAKQDILKGFRLGADDYLVKPFGIRDLVARVSSVLDRSSVVS